MTTTVARGVAAHKSSPARLENTGYWWKSVTELPNRVESQATSEYLEGILRLYPIEVEGEVLLRVGVAVSPETLLEIRRG